MPPLPVELTFEPLLLLNFLTIWHTFRPNFATKDEALVSQF